MEVASNYMENDSLEFGALAWTIVRKQWTYFCINIKAAYTLRMNL